MRRWPRCTLLARSLSTRSLLLAPGIGCLACRWFSLRMQWLLMLGMAERVAKSELCCISPVAPVMIDPAGVSQATDTAVMEAFGPQDPSLWEC